MSADLMELCRAVSDVAQQHANRHHDELSAPVEALRAARDAGLYRLAIPSYMPFGLGLSYKEVLAATRVLARGDAAFALGFHMHQVALGFLRHPQTYTDTASWMAEQARTKLFCSLASEPKTRGDDLLSFIPAVQARCVPGGFVVNGTKQFASNFEVADYALVSTNAEWQDNPKGSALLVINTTAEGITVEDIWSRAPGMRSTRSNRVHFKDVFVPEERLLLEADNFLRLFLVEAGVLTYGYTAVYLGGAHGLITEFMNSGERNRTMLQLHLDSLSRAWQELEQGADLYDQGQVEPSAVMHLLNAKYNTGKVIADALQDMLCDATLHDLFNPSYQRAAADMLTANIMPPSTKLILHLQQNPELLSQVL